MERKIWNVFVYEVYKRRQSRSNGKLPDWESLTDEQRELVEALLICSCGKVLSTVLCSTCNNEKV